MGKLNRPPKPSIFFFIENFFQFLSQMFTCMVFCSKNRCGTFDEKSPWIFSSTSHFSKTAAHVWFKELLQGLPVAPSTI